MKKNVRKILFFACLTFFIFLAPGLVFYSQGYRVHWNLIIQERKIKITQTGGLFVKAWPRQVEVYLDSEFKKRTDFFFGSTLIENLLPKRYKILVKREGFHSWEKILPVEEKLVTRAENLILFPQDPSLIILSQGIEKFWFFPEEKRIIFKELKNEEKEWALKLYNIENNTQSHLIESKDIHPQANFLSLKFENLREILLEVEVKEKLEKYLLEINQDPPLLKEKEDRLILPENVFFYQELNGEIYYLDNSGHLFKTKKVFQPQTKITENPLSILPESEYKIELLFEDFLFLQKDKTLYLLNPEKKSFDIFFQNLKGLELSPDNKKMVYFSEYEVWILFLKEKKQLPIKRVGEKLFLLRLSEKIEEVSWLNNDYLIFANAKKIQITEIDERDRVNVINFTELESPEIFFSRVNKKLYILSKGSFYVSEKLLP